MTYNLIGPFYNTYKGDVKESLDRFFEMNCSNEFIRRDESGSRRCH